jgi:hypothetical protein
LLSELSQLDDDDDDDDEMMIRHDHHPYVKEDVLKLNGRNII